MVSDGGVPSGGVVEAFEVWSKTAYRAWFRVAKRSRCSSSVSRVAKNDSATALTPLLSNIVVQGVGTVCCRVRWSAMTCW